MKYALLLALLTTALTLPAQNPVNTTLIDAYLDSLDFHDQTQGSLVLLQDGEQVYARAIGSADPERTTAATPTHGYKVGSITKTFTATIIYLLARDGKLSLNDKLAKWYPTVPNAENITLDMMLRHQSGIANYTAVPGTDDYVTEYHSPEELLALIVSLEPDFAPEASVAYSNSNYLLLGYIAETVSGQPYRQLLRDYVLEPTGLANTYVGGAYDAGKREVVSYEYGGGDWRAVPSWDMSNAGAAGFLVSTADDIGRFYYKLLTGGLLPEETVTKMKTIEGGLGAGLFSFPFGNMTAYGHNGGIEAFESMAGHFPAEGLTIVWLGNGTRRPVNTIMVDVLTIAFGMPFEIPDLTPTESVEVDLATLQSYVGTYKSADFPLDITVRLEGDILTAQATGQGAFPLTPLSQAAFEFANAGIRLDFDAGAETMRLRQGGNDVTFTRE